MFVLCTLYKGFPNAYTCLVKCLTGIRIRVFIVIELNWLQVTLDCVTRINIPCSLGLWYIVSLRYSTKLGGWGGSFIMFNEIWSLTNEMGDTPFTGQINPRGCFIVGLWCAWTNWFGIIRRNTNAVVTKCEKFILDLKRYILSFFRFQEKWIKKCGMRLLGTLDLT